MRDILLVTNFDNTIAQTSIPNNGSKLTLGLVYRIAINRLFGVRGEELFMEQEGYRNRSALEILSSLAKKDPTLLPRLTEERSRIKRPGQRHNFHSAPPSKEYPAGWNEVERYADELADVVRDYLEAPLSSEVSSGNTSKTGWPQPSKGFLKFWKDRSALEERANVRLTTAIISSNHSHFIKAVFDLWGVAHPDILLADDCLRWRSDPPTIFHRLKPHPFPLLLACQLWQGKQDSEETRSLTSIDPHRQSIICCGDDEWVEGRMAEACGVPFLRFVPSQKIGTRPLFPNDFNHWGSFPALLEWKLFLSTVPTTP